ncbi:GT-D fold domain-containing glycosyltransferase [Paenibacillus thalictri]|uniref:GT-D fold-like domain-containing protein n=1 Tax=Paenibacillus thalictri TaxID=2527873 RepID=A0A4Q9DT10_9BACL|nr:GT-D fold domain-containing glycosyltransferase [Paenibacillus thalictri]TBL78639.1 hypothetical protein EYB31_14170 [Paenibacillus thalictri]
MFQPTNLDMVTILKLIRFALDHKQPFSLVRIGDGENIVLAQDSVWSIDKVLKERWAIFANKGLKGVTLPNLGLRNELIKSIRKADVVGLLDPNDQTIKASSDVKRPLTDQILAYYKLSPKQTCNAIVNRMFVNEHGFWELLRGRRILIITRYPEQLKEKLEKKQSGLKVTMMIRFSHYSEMEGALKEIAAKKDSFDIALISCGVNAVILAQKVAELAGKVGIDFGKAPDRIFAKE